MKLSKGIQSPTNRNRTKSAMKPLTERGTFYNSQYQSISNRRLQKFVNQSRRSKIKLSEIMQSIRSVCGTMCFGSSNQNAMEQVSTTANNKTQYLISALRKINNTNNNFNKAFYALDSTDPPISSGHNTKGHKPFLTEVYNEKDDIAIDNKEDQKLGLSQISYVHFDTEDNYIDEDALAKSFNKQLKLKKLKGEIKLEDQLRKYGRNKTFEKRKVFREGHFFRKEQDTIKYKPKAAYDKENLYFKRNYNSNRYNTNNNYIGYNQKDIQSHSLLTKSHKPRLSLNSNSLGLSIPLSTSKLQTPYGKKTNKNTRKLFLSSSRERQQFPEYSSNNNTNIKDHIISTNINTDSCNYNPLMTTASNSTKMNSTLMTTNNRPMTAIGTTNMFYASKHKKVNLTQKKFDLVKFKSLYSNIYKEGEAFKRTIKDDFTKEKETIKKKHKNLPIEELRKELNLDKLYPKLDEDKLTIENAERVMKNLDKNSQELLNQIVKEMMHKEEILNKKYYEESVYDQKIRSLKEKKEFQKVVDEMMALKKKSKIYKPYKIDHEKKKMLILVKQKQEEEWVDPEKLKEYLQKCHIMNTIKPLINIDRRGPFKRIKNTEDVDI